MNLPLTRDEFEATLEDFCKRYGQPVTDDLRFSFVGFIHSLDRTVFTTTHEKMDQYLLKSISNHMSYLYSQELAKKLQAAHADQKTLSIVQPEEAQS